MKSNTFYPEIIVNLIAINKSSDKDTIFNGILDNGEKIKIKFSYEKNKLLDFFQKKAEKDAKDDLIIKKVEEIKKNEKLVEEISNQILNEKPDLVSNPLNLMKELESKIKEIAKKQLINELKIKSGSVVQLAGITNDCNDICVLNSKFDMDKDKGIYRFATIGHKIPLKVKTFKNKDNEIFYKVKLNIVANNEHINNLKKHLITTYNAKKENKINNIPRIFISFNKNLLDKNLIEIINNINNELNKPDEKIVFDVLNKNLEKFFEIYVNMSFNERKNINIYLPFYLSKEQIENKIKFDILEGNNSIFNKLLRTTYTKTKEELSEDFIMEKLIETFNELKNEAKLEFNTSYYIDKKRGYGFFNEILNKFVLSIDNYTDLINITNEKINKKI